jgi:hypothetical protein
MKRTNGNRRRQRESRLVTLEEQWLAIDLIVAGTRSPDDPGLKRRITKVWRATTPHELWKASGGLVGERRRGDWWAWRGAIYRVLAIIPLGLAALWVIAWGLRQFYG